MIFNDEYLKNGDTGGSDAAADLWSQMKAEIASLDLPSDAKIVTRIYANLKGLGDICTKKGIIARPDVIESFFKGFTGSKQLFDFVDVGAGKDRADDKLSGMAPHVLQIIQNHAHHLKKYSNYIFMIVTVDKYSSPALMTTATPAYWKM